MFSLFRRRFEYVILTNARYRYVCAKIGAWLNLIAYHIAFLSRTCVRLMNHHVTDNESDWFLHGLPKLHARINVILDKQRREYGSYYYFYGYPYQALGILGIYGERPTEERFEAYGLKDLISRGDRILDIGCNCGFMALYTSLRTGCHAVGIDVNPYMIEIGRECTKYLRMEDRVSLRTVRIQDFKTNEKFNIVMSFATHWTDDGNYRVPLREHLKRCASYLVPGGKLIFESHANDVGNRDFYDAIESCLDMFSLISKRDTDRGTRHLYVFKRIEPEDKYERLI